MIMTDIAARQANRLIISLLGDCGASVTASYTAARLEHGSCQSENGRTSSGLQEPDFVTISEPPRCAWSYGRNRFERTSAFAGHVPVAKDDTSATGTWPAKALVRSNRFLP